MRVTGSGLCPMEGSDISIQLSASATKDIPSSLKQP